MHPQLPPDSPTSAFGWGWRTASRTCPTDARLNNYLDLASDDLIAADEGFNFAGQLQATLADAVEHTASIRERLVEIQSKTPK
jgi:hypothetical protein